MSTIIIIVLVDAGFLLAVLAIVALIGWYYQDAMPEVPWWKRWVE